MKTLHGRELVLGQAGGPAPPGREGGGPPPRSQTTKVASAPVISDPACKSWKTYKL